MIPSVSCTVQGCLNSGLKNQKKADAMDEDFHIEETISLEVVKNLSKCLKAILPHIPPKPLNPDILG
jgi:hypothetical protein